jgi:hypothetical protein
MYSVRIAVCLGIATLMPEQPAEGQCDIASGVVMISQESAPGAGDFFDNVLGFVRPYFTTDSTAEFYAYDVENGSYNGICPPQSSLVDNRSLLVVGETSDGLALVIIHDNVTGQTGSEGHAEMRFELLNDPDGMERTVEDDPEGPFRDMYIGEPGDTVFASAHNWDLCCTDGLALSDLDGGWSMIVEFTEVDGDGSTAPIEELDEWIVYSADGILIPLALEVDRRVRLDSVMPCPSSCPGDVNTDGVVDVFDLLEVLAAWGACP